ncbi:hypothetical protein [Bradyrhizobium sp. JYMT SZCCT0428]|uniref:hypothetical protein n=1 Tax=Bradyrhizobium sp. JYMT SZCCT0428 TaxID=2807673 RepID=UPI001BABF800|nr:hypothetical protein [Bradyrhizobium sp. JYMT SZCCT0428]MBR1153691.1 hypothetical protein [Bradyrhizobium sp. JYMT SZCCT0428]
MLDFLKRRVPVLSRTVEVGWTLDTDKATFIWDAPVRLTREEQKRPEHAKALSYCPAIIEHEARIFQVNCPIDIQIRVKIDEKTKQPTLASTAGDMSTIRPKALSQMMTLVSPKEWRHPNRPILQVSSPYVFLADEPVYMMQLPPFAHYPVTPLPGLMIGGRLPINIWPRHMMWAFEWYDINKELVIRRGEPWYYVRFETNDPSRPVRLIEAEMTPQLKEYMAGLSAVTNYVNRTFSLFDTAKARRPKTLLVPKKR